MTDQDRVEALLDLPCDEQFRLATRLAANVGYVLTPEPLMDAAIDRVSPDVPAEGWTWQEVIRGARDAAAFCDCSNHPNAPEWSAACGLAAIKLEAMVGRPGTAAAVEAEREIGEHIAWMWQYINCMTEKNWGDMQAHLTRQLNRLAAAIHNGESR